MGRHEFPQDPADQFGHAKPLVEREVAEPAALLARDRDRELDGGRLRRGLLVRGADHRCCLPCGLRHLGPPCASILSAGGLVSSVSNTPGPCSGLPCV